MKMKNDLSFVFHLQVNIYEHQSSVNPNMPLRDLFYVASLLQSMTADKDLYSRKLIMIPAPRFVVFYNGQDDLPERSVLRLSSAYEKKMAEPELELTVTVLNINYGRNRALMDKCRKLHDYAWFIAKVRENLKAGLQKEVAVNKAIDEAIRNGILAEYLKKHRGEVLGMTIFEYDEEQHLQTVREEGREEGLEEGRKEGYAEAAAAYQQQLADMRARLAKYEPV